MGTELFITNFDIIDHDYSHCWVRILIHILDSLSILAFQLFHFLFLGCDNSFELFDVLLIFLIIQGMLDFNWRILFVLLFFHCLLKGVLFCGGYSASPLWGEDWNLLFFIFELKVCFHGNNYKTVLITRDKYITFLAAHKTVIFCGTPKGSYLSPKSGSHSQDAAAAEWVLAITD